ncbi:F0F1 ATP synthase subunit A [Blattabacterium cuenoti]|uniref:ATP synthase subunit a n=1 Tax=Blattabacterium sp. (Balta sp.) TaxID=2712791 RepID=A0A6G6BY38_9FLAO|nr:F0F1 ATP synthase subunit A [Blattabacterium cuenoti]QID56914.1 ATP synthase subunit A [Blattabacterium sp. (Balta sp.)]
MISKFIRLFFIFFISFLFLYGLYGNNNNNINKKNKLDVSNIIFDHISDSHEWTFIENSDKKISIPLPIIIWNNGFDIFLSSKLYNGKLFNGKHGYYKMFHEIIYETDKSGNLIFKNNKLNNRKPIDISITKNVISIIIAFLIIIYSFIRMKKEYDNIDLRSSKNVTIKWKIGILIEYIIIFIREEIAISYIGKKMFNKYINFLLSSFFFILVNNLMGIIPIFPNVTGNINVTFVLSTITFIMMMLYSKKSYWKHILWMPNVPIGIKFILAPIEFIGVFIRPITLGIRLFANIMAGHIIILSFICLIFIFKNIFIIGFSLFFGFFISLLEIMVSFLQSFIFTTLSALIIGMSIKNYEKN